MTKPSLLYLALSAALTALATVVGANEDVSTLMHGVFERPSPKSEVATLDIENISADGRREYRIMGVEKLGRDRRLFYFREPAELRGMALLGIDVDGRRDRWLYIPAARATRRIAGTQQRDSFMDTQFSYEDIDDRRFDEFSYDDAGTATTNERPTRMVDATPRDPSSAYGRIRFHVDVERRVLLMAEMFDHSEAQIKTGWFRNYTQFGPYLLADEFEMRNLRSGRTSHIRVRDRQVDQSVPVSRFSPNNLPRIR